MQRIGQFSILLVAFILDACSPDIDRATLVNRADKEIKNISVAIGKTAMEFGPLSPNQKIDMIFTNAGGTDYHVRVTFSDGQKLDSNVGYVTSQLSSTDTIEVYDNKVRLAP